MDLLNKLGIHPTLLLAQIINFLILMFVLYKFVYNPVLNLMEKREKKIKKSLDKAKEIDEKLEKIKIDYDKKMTQAKKEALKILEEAKNQAEKEREASLQKTKKEVAEIIKKAKEQISLEKEKLVEEAKDDLDKIVILAVEKILDQRLDKEINNKTVQEIIKQV